MKKRKTRKQKIKSEKRNKEQKETLYNELKEREKNKI